MAAQGTQQKYDHDRIERAARIYSSSKDAATALGIAQGSFIRLCRSFGVRHQASGASDSRATGTLDAVNAVEHLIAC